MKIHKQIAKIIIESENDSLEKDKSTSKDKNIDADDLNYITKKFEGAFAPLESTETFPQKEHRAFSPFEGPDTFVSKDRQTVNDFKSFDNPTINNNITYQNIPGKLEYNNIFCSPMANHISTNEGTNYEEKHTLSEITFKNPNAVYSTPNYINTNNETETEDIYLDPSKGLVNFNMYYNNAFKKFPTSQNYVDTYTEDYLKNEGCYARGFQNKNSADEFYMNFDKVFYNKQDKKIDDLKRDDTIPYGFENGTSFIH